MNDGQRKMLELGDSLGEIARRSGASKQTVIRWRDGLKRPAAEFRTAMWTAYGIPITDWDHGDGVQYADYKKEHPWEGQASPAPAPKAKTAPKGKGLKVREVREPKAWDGSHPGVTADALELIEYQLQDLIALGREIDAEGLLADRLKVREAQRKAVAELAKIRGELDQADETKLCKTAKWIRLRTAIITTLADFPEALEAVIETLAREEA